MRIDKVYTKGGDLGETSLIGGERVSKASPRIDCYGTVDELNATIGLVIEALASSQAGPFLSPILRRVQNELFNLGAELACGDAETRAKLPRIEQRHVDGLERDIDAVNDELPGLKSFVLPGGGWPSAYCHLARTVCRRAERLVVALGATDDDRRARRPLPQPAVRRAVRVGPLVRAQGRPARAAVGFARDLIRSRMVIAAPR